MAFSVAFSNPTLSPLSPSSSLYLALQPATAARRPFPPRRRNQLIRALAESESDTSKPNLTETKVQPKSAASTSTATPVQRPQKPVYSMKKGQIVRVDKDKYLNSINYLSVDHPPYYKGLDYIYEDRGEVLDLRNFDTGEYALVAWVGVPTAPAWLPTEMLIKSDQLDYERM